MRQLLKSVSLFALVLSFVVVGSLVRLLFFWNQKIRRRLAARLLQMASKIALIILNMKLRIEIADGLSRKTVENSGFIVSNHLSFLDVVAISSELACVFVTSEETREDLLLGLICASAGCYFAERRDAHRLKKELRELCDLMKSGIRIGVFPEATTSDGRGVLPFKRGFFKTPELANVSISSMVVNYEKLDGTSLDRSRADRLFYYGDIKFKDNILSILRSKSIEVSLSFVGISTPAVEAGRPAIHESVYELVAAHYKPIL
ncbi:MAG: 1-acyl-sn-glycerol-3-phosphate acyltransferase [Bdellovibrionales bacterium]|nr:1-acyl-sn-glycerol-3-phosphate acyltransferase [Bdellovibrionales bacterium]